MRGRFQGFWIDPINKVVNVMLSITGAEIKPIYERLKDKDLEITIKQFRKHRSKDANALLWNCLSDIAKSMKPPADKWDVYVEMLKRYGKYTYICVHPNSVEAMQKQWRETEIVGEMEVNGQPAVQMLCYFGSSTYNSKEFSVLLDGVIEEMRQMELPLPTSKEMRNALANIK